MTKLKPFLAIALIAGGWWFLRSPASDREQPKEQPTNATCGRCSADFWAGWASVTRCPSCGFSMSAARAKREHGPERYPLPDPPRLALPPSEPAAPAVEMQQEGRPWLIPALSLVGIAALLAIHRRLRRKK